MSTSAPTVPMVHTSDLITFRRCRRRWDFSSPLRRNMEAIRMNGSARWFGTGFHGALEDYHGYRNYSTPGDYFSEYVKGYPTDELPEDWAELLELGKGMLDYYLKWLERRDTFPIAWVNGIPQVEVKFEVPVYDRFGNFLAVYAGKLDGVAFGQEGHLWVKEYKTAKQFNTSKLEKDPQVTAYTWAAQKLYTQPVDGVVYMQFYKGVPTMPQVLKRGGISQNKQIRTSYAVYRQALVEFYGGADKIPVGMYDEFLNALLQAEDENSDPFILRTLVYRNEQEVRAYEDQVIEQVQEMLNPNIAVYPNPTRDCSWDCDFKSVCVAMDDGSDWELLLNQGYRRRNADEPLWKADSFEE